MSICKSQFLFVSDNRLKTFEEEDCQLNGATSSNKHIKEFPFNNHDLK